MKLIKRPTSVTINPEKLIEILFHKNSLIWKQQPWDSDRMDMEDIYEEDNITLDIRIEINTHEFAGCLRHKLNSFYPLLWDKIEDNEVIISNYNDLHDAVENYLKHLS